jgi:hypothetical protein
MTVLEQALAYIIQVNWKVYNVNRLIVPPPDPSEPQLVTWTRELKHLRPINQDPPDIPYSWGQAAGDKAFEQLRPPIIRDTLYEEEPVSLVQEPRNNHDQVLDDKYPDGLFGSESDSD